MTIQYIISPVTTFNECEEIYETKVGTNNPGLPLHYIVCGKSAEISRSRAQELVKLLNGIAERNLPLIN